MIQLSQGNFFNHLTLSIVRDHLELLAKRDYNMMARKLSANVQEVRQAAEKILALNPIPARGFAGQNQTNYAVPEAKFSVQDQKIILEFNDQYLARVQINQHYAALIDAAPDATVRNYIKDNLTQAQTLIKSIQARRDTLLQVMTYIAQVQRNYFCHGGQLVPLTMQKAAQVLGVNVSTASRAVQNKYIEFHGKILPLRNFFTTAIKDDKGTEVSSHAVKHQILHLIYSEDPTKPLSDDGICTILLQLGIPISRRTVAKYRTELGIESSVKRKRFEP